MREKIRVAIILYADGIDDDVKATVKWLWQDCV
jgi:hypothetical protein